MRMIYIVVGVFLAVGLFFFVINNQTKQSDNPGEGIAQEDTVKARGDSTTENVFEGLRKMALDMTPEQLELSFPTEEIIVYGMIMDWEMGDGIATLTSFQTGDASLYLSSGGAIIGGRQHENVSRAAKQFIALSQGFLKKTAQSNDISLPVENEIKFYFLTNHGRYTARGHLSNFENQSSQWLQLFEAGNNLITEIRMVSDMK